MVLWRPAANSAARRAAWAKRTPRSSLPEPLPRHRSRSVRRDSHHHELAQRAGGRRRASSRAAARPDRCSGKPPQPRAVRRPVRARTRLGHDPGRRIGQVHLQDQSQRRDHQLSPELFTDSTHDELPSRRCEQAAHRRQHGALVVLLRPVEQVSRDSLSGVFCEKKEEGGNTMNRMHPKRLPDAGQSDYFMRVRAHSRGATHRRPLTPKNPAAPNNRSRHQNELTFTQIDVPGAMDTVVFGLNDRGQIVGSFVDPGRRIPRLSFGQWRVQTNQSSQPAKPEPTESIIAARSWAYSLMPRA